jgi:chorismate dehydratase
MLEKIKVGFPRYINTLPLLHYLEPEECGVEIVSAPPRSLNQMLREGEIQASLSSSVVYAKSFQEYLLLPDISISAVGRVRSVILFHKEELKKLSKRPIAITPETESSFLLLRVLLEEFVGVRPDYIQVNKKWSELQEREREQFSGYLAIGDEALLLGERLSQHFITDLAKLWLDFTGLPFVFALLIVRKDVCRGELVDRIKRFMKCLYLARARAFGSMEQLLKQAPLPLPLDTVHNYLSCLEYDFSFLKQRAFLTFSQYLLRKKIISSLPELTFLSI